MQYKCKVTVIDKKCFPDYQKEYLSDPQSGVCPFYEIGDEFIFERYGGEDTFWLAGDGTQCGEAWDCISRYIYTALQGGSIMRGWTKDERMMIACCNDGTRPVIFKIERLDYKVVKILGMVCEHCASKIKKSLSVISGVDWTSTGRKYLSKKTKRYRTNRSAWLWNAMKNTVYPVSTDRL